METNSTTTSLLQEKEHGEDRQEARIGLVHPLAEHNGIGCVHVGWVTGPRQLHLLRPLCHPQHPPPAQNNQVTHPDL